MKMNKNAWKHLGFYLLVLFLIFLLISDGRAGRKSRKKKNKSHGSRNLHSDAKGNASKSSNKKKSKSQDPEAYNNYKNVGRSGIRPLQSITQLTKSKTSTLTTTTAIPSTNIPRIKSFQKLTPPTSSAATVVTSATVKGLTSHQPSTTETSKSKAQDGKSFVFYDVVDAAPSNNIAPTTTVPEVQGDWSLFKTKEWNVPSLDHHNSTKTPTEYPPPSGGIRNPYVCHNKDENRKQTLRLCGYPAIYNQTHCAEIYCSEKPLSVCENKGEMVVFGITTLFLGISIILGNCLLPYVVYRRRNMRSHHNYIKVSLAFADILIGVLLVSSVLPNMFWIRSISEMGLVNTVLKETNSVTAVLAGSLLVVSIESSLLHLAFLALERLLALNWSLQHRRIGASKIGCCLVFIWVLSLLLAFTPAIFPDKFEYTLLPVLFLYMLTTTARNEENAASDGQLYACLTTLLPYALMVSFCVLTGVAVRRKLRKSRLSDLVNSDPRVNTDSPEVVRLPFRTTSSYVTELKVFKTLLIMIGAFSATILPLVIMLIVYNTSSDLDCENYSITYTVVYFATISNSLVNVVIYTGRDERFRKAFVSEVSRVCKRRSKLQKVKKRRQEIYSTSLNLS